MAPLISSGDISRNLNLYDHAYRQNLSCLISNVEQTLNGIPVSEVSETLSTILSFLPSSYMLDALLVHDQHGVHLSSPVHNCSAFPHRQQLNYGAPNKMTID